MAEGIRTATQVQAVPAPVRSRALDFATEVVVLLAASLFVGLCARVTLPLNFTPVPITLQTFAILLLAFLLGSRRACAALALYLVQGAAGLPLFSAAGPGGVAQLFGPTGGYLLAYPAVAYIAGRIYERSRTTKSAVLGWLASDVVLYSAGALWLVAFFNFSPAQALLVAVFPFLPGDLLKAAAAIAIARGWQRYRRA